MTEPVAITPEAVEAIANPGRLLTADEVAQRWQVPKAHVYRLGRDGRLATVRLGRYMRWRVDAIEAFERDGGASPNV